MTNSETIEKLNDALNKLIDAYKVLLEKNNSLENDIKQKNESIHNLEERLNELNGNTEVQSTKMDGMLNKIQSLLTTNTISTDEKEVLANNDKLFDVDIDLKISDDSNEIEETTNNTSDNNENKIDLGRMESLLNGLNTK
jgi:chromosome segregation ATPase